MITIGSKVDGFTVDAYVDGDFKEISIYDYVGKWVVLLFYPADFTFVCPTELEEAADHYEAFKKLGAEVMSVSADTKFTHKAWHDTSKAIGKVQYPMLADPTGKVCRQFGTYIEEGEDAGLSRRASFIIDPEGIARFYEIHDNSIGRSIKEIYRKLEAAKYVREHDGQVCPASWEPGDETLTPGAELVGKI